MDSKQRLARAGEILAEVETGWVLHRIASTTYVKDITRCAKEVLVQVPNLAALMRAGMAYRCRIAKGPFFYSAYADQAAEDAVRHYKEIREKDKAQNSSSDQAK